MFDFGQIIEKVTGFLGDTGGVQEVLGNVNIDSAILENLPLDQVEGYLGEAGIDTATLTEGQLGAIVQKLTGPGGGA